MIERFEALTAFLIAHREVWTPRPFVEQPVSWEASHPAVGAWLRRRTLDELEALEADIHSPLEGAPVELERWRAQSRALSSLSLLDLAPVDALSQPALRFRVPQRKWRQIEAFAAAVDDACGGHRGRIVDWCAGKGHLGRALSVAHGVTTTVVERREDLFASGQKLARRAGASCDFVAADALAPETVSVLEGCGLAVSMHACGALTDSLLRGVCQHRVPVSVSALCCYHFLGREETYTPLSARGQRSGLALTPTLLRLPIFDEVVARPRERLARRREMAFRAGLSLLMKEITGVDRYYSPGNLSPALLKGSFVDFCQRLLARDGVRSPTGVSIAAFEAPGQAYAIRARLLGMARAVFRRPLELWLVLDRALFLQESGRRVALSRFCIREVTPRNLLLSSWL